MNKLLEKLVLRRIKFNLNMRLFKIEFSAAPYSTRIGTIIVRLRLFKRCFLTYMRVVKISKFKPKNMAAEWGGF